jgi:hypothetical protein
MFRQRAAVVRSLAAGLTLLVSLTAAAPAALAKEIPNPWKLWVEDLGDRESKISLPFLVLVSIAPMIAITPLWLGQLALEAMEGDD